MALALPSYNGKDYLVMPLVVLPFAMGLNASAFGLRYFDGPLFFLLATLLTSLCTCAYFILAGGVAVLLRNRFPQPALTLKRLCLNIAILLCMSGLFLLLLFRLYAALPFFGYEQDSTIFVWQYFALCICNIFLTFFMEGIDRYQTWRQSQKETDELRKSYQQSRLQGLRSQVNPHFLFNSLNALSSLIDTNEEAAETFLNELSKVYRYLLRNEPDALVPLEQELQFLQAYRHLLHSRYGSAIAWELSVEEDRHDWRIAPLSLQIVLENAIAQNVVSRLQPLQLSIGTGDDHLWVRHNLQPKALVASLDAEEGLDVLLNKYRLLSGRQATVVETGGRRIIGLPLFAPKPQEKEVAA